MGWSSVLCYAICYAMLMNTGLIEVRRDTFGLLPANQPYGHIWRTHETYITKVM